jgi:hypothetical protein
MSEVSRDAIDIVSDETHSLPVKHAYQAGLDQNPAGALVRINNSNGRIRWNCIPTSQ